MENKLKNNILAVIVTFNPDIKRLKENVESLKNQVENILIVDNNSNNISIIESIVNENNLKIKKISKNLGIAAALNKGLYFAKFNKMEYILTMDQDSIATENMVKNLLKGFSRRDIAIVSPSIIDLNYKEYSTEKISEKYKEKDWTITSGSLNLIEPLIKIGGFKEELFIDLVDTEVCLRLRRNKYLVFLSRDALLYHELGESKVKYFLGIKFIVTNHSPFRIFYIFRNSIYINKTFYIRDKKKYMKLYLKLMKKIICIILYEKGKKIKLINAYNGLKIGLKEDINDY